MKTGSHSTKRSRSSAIRAWSSAVPRSHQPGTTTRITLTSAGKFAPG